MKKILLIIFAALLISGCGNGKNPAQVYYYKVTELPEGWMIDESEPQSAFETSDAGAIYVTSMEQQEAKYIKTVNADRYNYGYELYYCDVCGHTYLKKVVYPKGGYEKIELAYKGAILAEGETANPEDFTLTGTLRVYTSPTTCEEKEVIIPSDQYTLTQEKSITGEIYYKAKLVDWDARVLNATATVHEESGTQDTPEHTSESYTNTTYIIKRGLFDLQ